LKLDDVPLDGKQIFTWRMDPAASNMHKSSRRNTVMFTLSMLFRIAGDAVQSIRPPAVITGLYDTFIGTRANRARNSIEAGPIVRLS
jgi:hypothetical protein